MGVTDVVWSHQSRKITRSLEDNTVIKHLYLYLCTFDVVGSVAATIDNHLLYGVL